MRSERRDCNSTRRKNNGTWNTPGISDDFNDLGGKKCVGKSPAVSLSRKWWCCFQAVFGFSPPKNPGKSTKKGWLGLVTSLTTKKCPTLKVVLFRRDFTSPKPQEKAFLPFVKNLCISNRIITFQTVRHFPLNPWIYGRKSLGSF